MSLRIWLSQSDLIQIRPGLESLVNRLAGARAVNYPFRNAWDRVDIQASDIYCERAFSDVHATMILSLRNRVNRLGGAGKIRLDAFELAAVSLATRITRREAKRNGLSEFDERLVGKIEMHRKRAKRAAIVRFGQIYYEECAVQWQKFVQWVRYNLLSRYPRRPSSGELRRMWREQYQRLLRLAGSAVAERQYAANTPEELQRIVRLALAEIRRGRHPFTIRWLCSNEEQGKEFLFQFALARDILRHFPGSEPLCIRQSELGIKFQMALRSSPGILRMPANITRIDVSKTECAIVDDSNATEASPISNGPVDLSDDQIANAVAQWFQTELDPDLWEAVCTEAQFQVTHFPTQYIFQTSFRTLNGLIAKTRVPDIPVDMPEMINFSVEWLLRWLIALRKDLWLLHGIVGVGRARARKTPELFEATYY